MKYNDVNVGNVTFANNKPFVLIAGPCAMESAEHAMMMADELYKLAQKHNIPFIFKTSFDKANRTSIDAKRGLGLDKALQVFADIKSKYNIPVITDIHNEFQCAPVAEVVDILQIPAFLCRQTDLLVAAANTGKAVNIKKGQFLSPYDMQNIVNKFTSTGNNNLLLCDRGTSFGYNTLVTDFRGLDIMKRSGFPVVFDATHSVQMPGGNGQSTGGQREFAPYLARLALSSGIAAIFAESHEDPNNACSDGPNMIPLLHMSKVLDDWKAFDDLAKSRLVDIEDYKNY